MHETELLDPMTTPVELETRRRVGQRVLLIDVRTPVEYETLHIPGSENIPLDQLASVRAQLGRIAAAPLVMICRSGQRARQAQRILAEVDVPAVQVLDGGLVAWEASGFRLVRGRGHWSLERQARAIAGLLVLLGALGSLFIWPPLIFLAAFVGAGLLLAGLTDFCGLTVLLARLPYNRRRAVDPRLVVARLSRSS